MNITSLLSDVVKKVGTKTAIIENNQEISYRELWGTIERLSAAFYKIGIRENHRVALILPNSAEFIYCFFALLKINAIVSPLSPGLTPFELKRIFDNFKPYFMISQSTFVDKVLGKFPELLENKVLVFYDDNGIHSKIKNYYVLKKLLNLYNNYEFGNSQTSLDHIATINYTYRGAGYPLGAVLSHKSYVNGILGYIEWTRIFSQDRVLAFLSFSHVFSLVGCVLAPLIGGATVIISRNYLPKSILKLIGDFHVNRLTAIPSVYALLLQNYKEGEYDLRSLDYCITGGSYMPLEVQEVIKNKMRVTVLQGYGLTECLPITCNTHEYNKPGTLGLAGRPDIEIKIIGENSVYKEANQVGEIIINSPTMMQGYYNRKDESEKILKDGWFYTGDYGYMDEKGYLHYAGFKKNVAKVGGNMVDLKEVKDVLLSYPSILDCSVIPKNDDLWGHVLEAEVVTYSSKKLAESEIRSFCSKHLSRYKVPKTIKIKTEVAYR